MADLVLSYFAKNYPDVYFMASDFSAMTLKGCTSREDMLACTDIRGRRVGRGGGTYYWLAVEPLALNDPPCHLIASAFHLV